MSASYIKVSALDCDQGMGTLIKVYETDKGTDKLVSLALIDLGTDRRTEAQGAVTDVIDALKEMATPKIDLLVVSHQDKDHWSLLPDLQEKIGTDVPTTTMGSLYRGGVQWGKPAIKALKAWQTKFGVNFTPFAKSNSGYDVPGTKKLLKDLNDVKFRVLVTNLESSRSAGDLQKNGSSAVILVEFGGRTVILPGDAISETLGYINDLCAKWVAKGKGNPLTPCDVLQVPHHGALRTIADNYTAEREKKKRKVDIAGDFADNVSARYIVASAGYMSKHLHPSREVLKILSNAVRTDAAKHTYVDFSFEEDVWEERETEKGIYTTVLTIDSPTKRTSWTFTINASGAMEFFLEEKTAQKPKTRPTARPTEQLMEATS